MFVFGWFFRHRKAQPLVDAWQRQQPIPPEAVPQRRYLENAEYPLPKDQGELQRLDYQHYALHLTLGNHYLTPLPPKVRTIVDVGTGTGVWSCDMAKLFPDTLVLGLDRDTALFHQAPPENCLLRAGNILTGLPLPDQFAEFTHQRFLVLAIPDEQWPGAIRELVRVTRVGGWIEIVETDARVQAAGPATEQAFAWIDAVRQARGLYGEPVLHLGEFLAQEGLEEIETQEIKVKVGAWGSRAGQIMERDIVAAVQALKEPCCTNVGLDPRRFDACLRDMQAEWRRAQAFGMVYFAYGRRVTS